MLTSTSLLLKAIPRGLAQVNNVALGTCTKNSSSLINIARVSNQASHIQSNDMPHEKAQIKTHSFPTTFFTHLHSPEASPASNATGSTKGTTKSNVNNLISTFNGKNNASKTQTKTLLNNGSFLGIPTRKVGACGISANLMGARNLCQIIPFPISVSSAPHALVAQPTQLASPAPPAPPAPPAHVTNEKKIPTFNRSEILNKIKETPTLNKINTEYDNPETIKNKLKRMLNEEKMGCSLEHSFTDISKMTSEQCTLLAENVTQDIFDSIKIDLKKEMLSRFKDIKTISDLEKVLIQSPSYIKAFWSVLNNVPSCWQKAEHQASEVKGKIYLGIMETAMNRLKNPNSKYFNKNDGLQILMKAEDILQKAHAAAFEKMTEEDKIAFKNNVASSALYKEFSNQSFMANFEATQGSNASSALKKAFISALERQESKEIQLENFLKTHLSTGFHDFTFDGNKAKIKTLESELAQLKAQLASLRKS